MAVGTFGAATAAPRGISDGVLGDGLAIVRERWPIYAAMAAACGAAGILGAHDPLRFTETAAFRTVMASALLAIFFVFPSALRRYDPAFAMTPRRAIVMVAMLVAIGIFTEVGYVALVVPGIVVGVLLSQALLSAMTGTRDDGDDVVGVIVTGFARSISLTKHRFGATLAIVAASLAIVLVPFFIGLVCFVVCAVVEPRSLPFTAPALLLTFVYFESVRYALIVRWYARLSSAAIT